MRTSEINVYVFQSTDDKYFQKSHPSQFQLSSNLPIQDIADGKIKDEDS